MNVDIYAAYIYGVAVKPCKNVYKQSGWAVFYFFKGGRKAN